MNKFNNLGRYLHLVVDTRRGGRGYIFLHLNNNTPLQLYYDTTTIPRINSLLLKKFHP